MWATLVAALASRVYQASGAEWARVVVALRAAEPKILRWRLPAMQAQAYVAQAATLFATEFWRPKRPEELVQACEVWVEAEVTDVVG